ARLRILMISLSKTLKSSVMIRIHTLKERWQCDGFQRLFMVAVRLAHCLGDYLGDWMVRKVSDKERLEEIETKYSTLTVSSEKNSTEYTEVNVEDLVFLIQNGFKQAERVQELEEGVKEAISDIENISPHEAKKTLMDLIKNMEGDDD